MSYKNLRTYALKKVNVLKNGIVYKIVLVSKNVREKRSYASQKGTWSKKLKCFTKSTSFKKGTRNNIGRVLKNERFSQNVCVIKEVGVPVNELVSKK